MIKALKPMNAKKKKGIMKILNMFKTKLEKIAFENRIPNKEPVIPLRKMRNVFRELEQYVKAR